VRERKVHLRDRSQTAQAKIAFQNMRSILCNRFLSMKIRENVLQCYIEPFLLYGNEARTIKTKARKHLEAKEMWSYRRLLKIPWTVKTSNEAVLLEIKLKRKLLNCICRH
jgi:hypothetical protein